MTGLRLTSCAAVLALLTGYLFAPLVIAQEAEEEDGLSYLEQAQTRRTPAMRDRVYQRLADAQECAEADDIVCAEELLERVANMGGLNAYELAQMWNFRAFIYFGQDNYQEAIRAYEMVLNQPEIPVAMETNVRYTLTQLYFQQERYADAVGMLDTWFLLQETPSPDSYVLLAQIYYQLQDFQAGIGPILTAIDVATAQGRELQENWYRLLNVFYYELEDYPNVIDVLRTIIETWPKEEYFVQLSAMYGQEGDDAAQLGLYEVAYEAGWLEQGNEQVQLAQLLLQADAPIKAAYIMESGLEDGSIESSESNWRILAQAWQLAQEDENAIQPLVRAADLTETGEIDLRLAQSYQNLLRWEDCVGSAREALDKGELRREDQAYMILGACLFEQQEYGTARTAFRSAAEDSRSRNAANSWITFVDAEETREEELAAALAR
tara:strand:+ start:1428 stop:2738 length:1311 start_codon:yes stop_codon:yes gene_type:complete